MPDNDFDSKWAEAEESLKKALADKPAPPAAEETFESLFESNPDVPDERGAQPGDRVTGVVTRVTDEVVFVDIGAKSEGMVHATEFLSEEGVVEVAEGDSLELKVLSSGPEGVVLSRGMKLRGGREAVQAIEEAWAGQIPIEGRVMGVNKGGFDVEIGKVRAFCPISQIDATFCEHPEVFVGLKDLFQVTEFAEGGRRIVLSRRKLLEARARARAEELRERLTEGAEVEGRVMRIQPFGAFIDIGGLEGLCHVSEISRARVNDPSEVLKEGQEVRVKVLKVEEVNGKLRVGLSMKALEQDPWVSGVPVQEGQVITGKVARIQPFGAFVEIAPGVDGLVHVSQISWQRVAHPSAVLTEGQAVEARVLSIDPVKRRIALSIKEANRPEVSAEEAEAAREWNERPAREEAPVVTPFVGAQYDGIVDGVKPYGLFIRLPGAGQRVRGLLPNEETGVAHGADMRKEFPDGTAMKVEVIAIDDRGRLRLSRKAVFDREERAEVAAYLNREPEKKPAATQSMGLFGKLLAEKLKK
jgi:small subunit ribosomal protein S1